jgi:hypothetical protein
MLGCCLHVTQGPTAQHGLRVLRRDAPAATEVQVWRQAPQTGNFDFGDATAPQRASTPATSAPSAKPSLCLNQSVAHTVKHRFHPHHRLCKPQPILVDAIIITTIITSFLPSSRLGEPRSHHEVRLALTRRASSTLRPRWPPSTGGRPAVHTNAPVRPQARRKGRHALDKHDGTAMDEPKTQAPAVCGVYSLVWGGSLRSARPPRGGSGGFWVRMHKGMPRNPPIPARMHLAECTSMLTGVDVAGFCDEGTAHAVSGGWRAVGGDRGVRSMAIPSLRWLRRVTSGFAREASWIAGFAWCSAAPGAEKSEGQTEMDSFTTGPLSLLTMSVKQNTQVRGTPRLLPSAQRPASLTLGIGSLVSRTPHPPPFRFTSPRVLRDRVRHTIRLAREPDGWAAGLRHGHCGTTGANQLPQQPQTAGSGEGVRPSL